MESKRMMELYRRVYSMPSLVRFFKIFGAVSVFFVAGVFAYGVGVLLFFGEFIYVTNLVFVAGIPFAVVTLMRYFINSPRPYEVFKIDEFKKMKAERKSGRSFPSRHVFSAFLIGMLWLPYSIPFGVACLILGVFIAFERVLLGIHFIRDVLAGATIGIVSGLIGMLIL